MISSRSEQVVKSPGFLNESSIDPPKSRADTVSPGLEGRPRYQLLLADGFEGVQLSRDDPQVSDGFIPFVGEEIGSLLRIFVWQAVWIDDTVGELMSQSEPAAFELSGVRESVTASVSTRSELL